ncbi:MAG: hypothetical protein GY809_14500 [Planctomycetes bacterium]|nr:hypothetical protein [Planctomycetota bacterium]
MGRHEIDIEVRDGGEVHVSIRGVKPNLCRKYKDFFTKVLQTTDEEDFIRILAPHESKVRQSDHEHLEEETP